MVPAAAVFVLALAVYAPVRSAEFVNYDDYHYVLENSHVSTGLTLKNAWWAFSAFAAGNWHPITWISHQLDCSLFGLEPLGPHVVNVLLHATNATLLLLVLFAMTGALWPSVFVAALFAAHPLNVESVAWVSERKNVLSTLLWIGTMGTYLRYTRRPSFTTYAGVALALTLGLLAKPMVVTLPAVLLLLDWWPLRRFDPDAADAAHRLVVLVREKLPLVLLSIASSVVTVAAQSNAGAMTTLGQVPAAARIANAAVSYCRYLAHMVWPAGLAVFYPHPVHALSVATIALAAALLILATLGAWALRTKPYYPVGWLWYLGTMVPVIGLVQVGSQAMADRYAYVPLVGIFAAIAWAAGDFVTARPAARPFAFVGAAGIVLALATLTYRQAGYWCSSIDLFEHAQAVTRGNYVAYTNLGLAYNKQKKWDVAISYFERALAVQPRSAEALGHMGLALARIGRVDEAIKALSKAIEIYPDSIQGHNNLGVALKRRDPDRAIEHFRRAAELDPDLAEARINLAAALLDKGQADEARRYFDEAVAIDPTAAPTHFRMASVFLDRGDLDRATAELEKVLAVEPSHMDAHNSKGVVKLRKGDLDGAIAEFRWVLSREPEHADAHSNLGTALYRKGQVAEGMAELEEAIKRNPHQADAHATLGAALARSGRLDEALEHFKKAVDSDPDNGVAQNNLGAALIERGDFDGAREHLLLAIKAAPRSADAHSNLGTALLQKGDLSGAIVQFQAALEIAPEHKNARDSLARAQAMVRR
jgi:tetratricopeptide (TPR) repeat protein